MDARQTSHPSADALRALALGNLDDETAELILRHLDACDECRREAAAQTNDDFLDQLRRAHGTSQTPVPAKSLGILDPVAGVGWLGRRWVEFPKESGQWVNGYRDRSYAAGVTYPSEECSRSLL